VVGRLEPLRGMAWGRLALHFSLALLGSCLVLLVPHDLGLSCGLDSAPWATAHSRPHFTPSLYQSTSTASTRQTVAGVARV